MMVHAPGNPDDSQAAHPELFWAQEVSRNCRLVNAGWWIEATISRLFVATLLLVPTILLARREGLTSAFFWSVSIGIAFGVFALSFLYARRHFVSADAIRAELDLRCRLHSRLTSAAAGVGPWPSKRGSAQRPLRWNWRRVIPIPIFSAALIVTAFLIPVPTRKPPPALPTAKPPALAEVEEWLERLSANDAFEPSSLEAPREEAEQLAANQPEEWYSHANLEAADHLRAQLGASLRQFADEATKLDNLLADLPNASAFSSSESAAFDADLQDTLNGLEGNGPRFNSALASQLRFASGNPRNLTPEQVRRIRERLREARGTCKECLGLGERESDGDLAGQGPSGVGGITRGPGSPPLNLSSEAAQLDTTKIEGVANDDLSHAELGETIGRSVGAPEVEKTRSFTGAGGALASPGAGADGVSLEQNLTPDEQRRLRLFFK